MRAPGRLGGVVLLVGLAACSEDPGTAATRQVIQDLVAQEYARATTRYRQNEDAVLSPAAAPLWRSALEHEDSTVREWAVDALSRIGLPEDADAVAARLGDPSRGVRQQARDGLIRMAPERAAEEFRERIGGAEPDQVTLAAEGLAILGTEDAVDRILARLGDEELPVATRGALTQPLAELGDPAAAEPLADLALDSGADVGLRRLAAEALVTLEGAGVEEQVERLAEADDEYVAALGREAPRSDR